MPFAAAISLFLTLSAVALQAGPVHDGWQGGSSFWVWNRSQALTPASQDELARIESGPLYWQLADLAESPLVLLNRVYRNAFSGMTNTTIVPVVRLAPGAATLTDPANRESIEAWTRAWAGEFPESALQIDYDCPASLLPKYAEALRTIREDCRPEFLSITALASWIDAPGFAQLAASVDEIVPMFYDLEADMPMAVLNGNALPMIDGSTIRWIAKWKACPVSWRAGLPNFQRLTLFADDGQLIGHHRQWSAGGLLGHPLLKPIVSSTPHTRHFEILGKGTLAEVSIRPGQILIQRMPDEKAAIRAIDAARKAGARGIVWFAHPDSAPVAWHSATHLAALQNGTATNPHLQLEIRPNGSILLSNNGPGDLPPRSDGRLRQIILEAETAGSFGPASPGDFATIDAPGSSIAHPELARSVVLSFPALRVGQSYQSGAGLVTSSDTPPWHLAP